MIRFGLRTALRRSVMAIVCGVLIAGAAGFGMFVHGLERSPPLDPLPAQGIVALTGSAERIDEALDLLAKGRASRLLITGVNPATSRDKLRSVAQGFRGQCCVDLGYSARNTAENARETANWARLHGIDASLIVVTSAWHMPRALAEMHRLLPGVALRPHVVIGGHLREGGWWQDADTMRMLAVEYAKYVAVLAAQTFDPRQPAPPLRLSAYRPG